MAGWLRLGRRNEAVCIRSIGAQRKSLMGFFLRTRSSRLLLGGRSDKRGAKTLGCRQNALASCYVTIRVVLVDDIADYRRLVRAALRFRGGFEVVGEAADGRTAVDVVAAVCPDVVVLDLGLPDLAGREVISQVRGASPGTEVVLFTGTHLDEAHELRAQVAGHVLKDSNLDVLVTLLSELGARETGEIAAIHLPRDLLSPATARAFVAAWCAQWGCDGFVDNAELIVSELVSNAVTHAASACDLRLTRTGAGLRIEIEDSGSGSPNVVAPVDDDEHGRGLLIVSALSTAWGVEASSLDHKRIWADLRLPAVAVAVSA
jgi:CheY-like chemotaxis protein